MRITVNSDELKSCGLEIGVQGFQHDAGANDTFPTQVYIEYLDEQLKIHVWDGGEDPVASLVVPRQTNDWRVKENV